MDPAGSSPTRNSNGTNQSGRGGRMAVRDILLLFLLLFLLQLQPTCSQPQESCLQCFNDLIDTTTCMWNITCMTNWTGLRENTACKLFGKSLDNEHKNEASCDLKPLTDSDSALRSCPLVFNRNIYPYASYSFEVRLGQSEDPAARLLDYRHSSYVKMYPPEKPVVVNSTISWALGTPVSTYLKRKTDITYQLEWKREEEPWKDAWNLNITNKQEYCDLDPDRLVRGARYQAQVRVLPPLRNKHSTWSDWSPAVSWISTVGEETNQQQDIIGILVGVMAALVILVFTICYKTTNKTTWIYIFKKVRGPPLPKPSMFFPGLHSFHGGNFNLFTQDSFLETFLCPVDISPVEITNTLDNVAPYSSEAIATLLEKETWNHCPGLLQALNSSTRHSRYSNESYSLAVCAPLPTSGGALAPCATDSPYGPVVVGKREEEVEEDGGMIRKEEIDSGLGGEEQFSQDTLDVVDRQEEAGEDMGTESLGETGDSDVVRERERGRESDIAMLQLLGRDIKGNTLKMSSSYQPFEGLQAQHTAPESLDEDMGTESVGETEDGDAERERERAKESEIEMLMLLSMKGGNTLKMSLSYERLGGLQAQHTAPESLDEDMGIESIGEMEDGDMEREGERAQESDIEMLMLLSIKGGNTLKMSSSYECLGGLQTQHMAPESLDLGMASCGEDREYPESAEESGRPEAAAEGGCFRSNVLQFHSCSSPISSPEPSFLHIPLLLPGKGMRLPPLTLGTGHPGTTLEELALIPSSMVMEPSSDGYLPVTHA